MEKDQKVVAYLPHADPHTILKVRKLLDTRTGYAQRETSVQQLGQPQWKLEPLEAKLHKVANSKILIITLEEVLTAETWNGMPVDERIRAMFRFVGSNIGVPVTPKTFDVVDDYWDTIADQIWSALGLRFETTLTGLGFVTSICLDIEELQKHVAVQTMSAKQNWWEAAPHQPDFFSWAITGYENPVIFGLGNDEYFLFMPTQQAVEKEFGQEWGKGEELTTRLFKKRTSDTNNGLEEICLTAISISRGGVPFNVRSEIGSLKFHGPFIKDLTGVTVTSPNGTVTNCEVISTGK